MYMLVIFISVLPETGLGGIFFIYGVMLLGVFIAVVWFLVLLFWFNLFNILKYIGILNVNPIEHTLMTMEDWMSTMMLLNEVRIPIMWIEY